MERISSSGISTQIFESCWRTRVSDTNMECVSTYNSPVIYDEAVLNGESWKEELKKKYAK